MTVATVVTIMFHQHLECNVWAEALLRVSLMYTYMYNKTRLMTFFLTEPGVTLQTRSLRSGGKDGGKLMCFNAKIVVASVRVRVF